MIFWHHKSWVNLTRKSYRYVHLTRCSYFTLGNPKKSFSTVLFIYTTDYLSYLRKKTNPHVHPTWKCHHTNMWFVKHFHPTEGLLCCLKRWTLKKTRCGLPSVSLKRTGCDGCVTKTGMSAKQRHSDCSEWPPSALIHASSLFRQWPVAQYTTLCWNSAHVATSSLNISVSIHTLLCSVPQTQY